MLFIRIVLCLARRLEEILFSLTREKFPDEHQHPTVMSCWVIIKGSKAWILQQFQERQVRLRTAQVETSNENKERLWDTLTKQPPREALWKLATH